MRFRKKPVEIEAVRWDGQNIDDVLALVDFDNLPPDPNGHVNPGVGQLATGELEIPTLEGTMTARLGDWIIQGVHGEVYPCKPDIFDATYEPVLEVRVCPTCKGTLTGPDYDAGYQDGESSILADLNGMLDDLDLPAQDDPIAFIRTALSLALTRDEADEL